MTRILSLAFVLVFSAVVGLALYLEPNPAGVGTHRALGLPACYFLTLFGVICPSCGLTTSFAWTVRGNLVKAFQVHPLGPLLFLLFAWVALLSLLKFLGTGKKLLEYHEKRWVNASFVGVGIFLGVWFFRVGLHFIRENPL